MLDVPLELSDRKTAVLTSTSTIAVQLLLYINRFGQSAPVSPADAAAQLDASPSYVSKIVSLLAKADIVHTYRGAKGGVRLSRPPEDITLLHIVEACQGKILGDYCREWEPINDVCAFHAAMFDLQHSIVSALSRHSLADLARKPLPILEAQGSCRMRCVFQPAPKEVSAEG